MKRRPAIAYKVKVTLQKEIALVCPFCKNKEAEHFEIHHIDNNTENNELSNLIMLCPTCHSKITKGDITKDEVVKKKLEISSDIKIEIDHEVKSLLSELNKLLDENKIDEAEEIYFKAKC